MIIDPKQVSAKSIYFRMISFIVPRPIAWVSTVSSNGVKNIAPFSFFSGVTSDPPTMLFCAGNKRDGSPKDTVRNLLETKECVVHVVPHRLTDMMVGTSVASPGYVDEFEWANVPYSDSDRVEAPRVQGAPVAVECRLFDHMELTSDNGLITSRVMVLRMELIHVDNALLDENGYIVPEKLDPVSRLGGQLYGRLGALFEVPRPKNWTAPPDAD